MSGRSRRWPALARVLGWRQSPRNDASTIMGMQLPGAYVLTVGVVLCCAALGLAGRGVDRAGLYLAGIALSLVSALVLLSAPSDPMDWRATLFVAVVPSGTLVLTALSTFEDATIADAPASGLLALIQAFMCVRGRLWSAWLSYLFSVAVMLALNVLIPPQPAFVAAIAPNTAVLLMATFFAAIVRPRARQIYTLRRQTERQIASAAAQEAAVGVRDQQLAQLDQRARPLLERIASGERPSDDVVAECGLVEAGLRDRIRAPGLDTPELAAAAWSARSRGVRVVLLDDHGWGSETLSSAEDVEQAGALLGPLRAAAADSLARADTGRSVTVRLLPAGRSLLGTVAVDGDMRRSRIEFGPDGRQIPGNGDEKS